MVTVKKLCGTLLLLLTVGFTAGQDAMRDLTAIRDVFYGAKSISMKVSYTVFESATSTTPIEKEVGEFKRSGICTYSSYGNLVSIVNKDYYVMIDKQDKEIFVSKIIRGKGNEMNSGPSAETITEMIKKCEKIEYKDPGNGYGQYDVTSNYTEFNRVIILFNKKSYLIEKLILFYRNKTNVDPSDKKSKLVVPRVEASYSSIEINPVINKSVFTYDKFLTLSRGKFLLKDPYKNFQLTDLYHAYN